MEGLIGSELRAPMLGASETVTNRLQQVLGVRE
jgi:4-hydroxy-tetrahydrodipicolinate synthase